MAYDVFQKINALQSSSSNKSFSTCRLVRDYAESKEGWSNQAWCRCRAQDRLLQDGGGRLSAPSVHRLLQVEPHRLSWRKFVPHKASQHFSMSILAPFSCRLTPTSVSSTLSPAAIAARTRRITSSSTRPPTRSRNRPRSPRPRRPRRRTWRRPRSRSW